MLRHTVMRAVRASAGLAARRGGVLPAAAQRPALAALAARPARGVSARACARRHPVSMMATGAPGAPGGSAPRLRAHKPRARLAPAAALSPASAFAVGSLFDGAVGAAVAAVLGGFVARLAERLWAKRHSSPLDVTHAETPGNAALLAACPRFSAPYDAVDVLRNRHACTIAVSLFRQNVDIEYQREVLRMPDGGHVTLDWPIAVPPVDDDERLSVSAAKESSSFVETSPKEEETSSVSENDNYDKSVAETIRQLQYGASSPTPTPSRSAKQSLGSAGPDGVPGVIGFAGGGGSDGCGSGGGGCDPLSNADANSVGPHRRSIPDQGKTVLRKRLAAHWRELPDDAPVLMLMSGIAGGSHDKYLKHFLRRAHNAGYRCVAFNCRGTSDSPLTTPQFYSASFTGDVRAVVDELALRWPDAPLFAVGWSLGANILTNFLGEEGKAAKVSGAVAMCNPFDLNACDDALQEGFFGTVYSRSMAGNMRKLFAPHAHLFAGLPNYDRRLVESARTVRDFDEAVTRVTFGFPSVDAYYDASSSRRLIGNVKVPLLVVQAKDDPIAVRSAVPRDVIRNVGPDANVILVETESGGHLGWSAGEEAPFGAPWPDVGAMQFLEAVRARTHVKAEGEKRGASAPNAETEVETVAVAAS
jgi:predicted alpha/beta-fold hydrolase